MLQKLREIFGTRSKKEIEHSISVPSSGSNSARGVPTCTLLQLERRVIDTILDFLESPTLNNIAITCKFFKNVVRIRKEKYVFEARQREEIENQAKLVDPFNNLLPREICEKILSLLCIQELKNILFVNRQDEISYLTVKELQNFSSKFITLDKR